MTWLSLGYILSFIGKLFHLPCAQRADYIYPLTPHNPSITITSPKKDRVYVDGIMNNLDRHILLYNEDLSVINRHSRAIDSFFLSLNQDILYGFNFLVNFVAVIELPRHIDLDNPEFAKAYELLQNTDANIFLTGKAGTGKSTFLRYICKSLNKKHVVLAPTGVAAVNVGGTTIHSFFQMPLRPVPPNDPDYSVNALKKTGKLSRQKRKLISELDLIIIDEVSMVRPDMIDFIDRTLRAVRGKRGVPFGGVQLLLVGDIFQLEPVVTPDTKAILANYYPDFFFFNALAYQSANLVAIELKKIYRQTDSRFINMLDRIRVNQVTSEDFSTLNSRVGSDSGKKDNDLGITLATRRDVVAMINKEKMDELPSEEVVFEGKIEDDFPEKILPTDLNLVLKKDAQVMMIRNDKERKWVNGTLGRVLDLSTKGIKVLLESGSTVNVEKETWENINYEYDEAEKKVKERVLGTFTQYPLKAAWALTIHKSQGLTFNNVTIDMTGGAFSAGQTYVALSRCRTLEGLTFVNPLRKYDVIVSEGASQFSKRYNDEAAMDKVLTDAKAKVLTRESLRKFNAGEFEGAVEDAWQLNLLTGAFGRKSVRRFVSRLFSELSRLRKLVTAKDNTIKRLSNEFVKIGDMCLDHHDDLENALKYFRKALDLDGNNDEAAYKTAVCYSEKGNLKKSKKILDKLIDDGSKMMFEALMLKGFINERGNDLANALLNYLNAAKLHQKDDTPIRKIVEIYEKFGMDDMADTYRQYLDENFYDMDSKSKQI